MPRQNIISGFRLAALGGIITSLTPLFVSGATANIIDPVVINRRVGIDYSVCARELLEQNIAPNQVAIACSQALIPPDLSLCAIKISSLTPIAALEALTTCNRVRRPLELSTCVTDIFSRTQGTDPIVLASSANLVMDNCRRSLLPLRFADCVSGLSQQINFGTDAALRTCIAAEESR